MARNTLPFLRFLLGLLLLLAFTNTSKAQQVTFALSPTQVTAAIGDTVKLSVVVQNFTNVVAFQYTIEWDNTLMTFAAVDSVTLPDRPNFLTYNPANTGTLGVAWNASSTGQTITNGLTVFRLKFKVIAASTNYWAKFSGALTTVDVTQDPGGRSVTPVFVNSGTPPGATATPVTIQSASSTVLSGQKVCVPVTTKDFTNMVTARFITKWNPAVLRFDSVSNFNSSLGYVAGNFNTLSISTGRMPVAWGATTPKSVADGSTLFNVCFTTVGANGTNSTVRFDTATMNRRAGGTDTQVGMTAVNGTVTVGTPPVASGLVFVASNTVGQTGDTMCVQIKAGSFSNIGTMTWSMHWDSTKVAFLNVSSNVAALGIDSLTPTRASNNFSNNPSGTLRFVWFTPSGLAVALPDSTVIYTVCFKYTGAAGTSSPFTFNGVPLKIKVTNADDSPLTLPVSFRAGSMTVAAAPASITETGATTNVTCPSGSNGSIILTVSGGSGNYTYAWTGPSGFTATTKDITARPAGAYSVTITSGTLTKTDNFTITQPTPYVVTPQITDVNCFAQSTGSINLVVSGATAPYTYAWAQGSATGNPLTGLGAGAYNVTISDARSCQTILSTLTVNQPSAPLSISSIVQNVACKNGTDGSITPTIGGGTAPYTYSWTASGGFTSTNKDIVNLIAKTYTITVTDSKNCTISRSDAITEPSDITISNTTIIGTRCSQATGSITIGNVAGGNGGYSYAWTGPSGFTATTKDLVNRIAGSYTLTVKDAKNCSFTAAAMLIVDTSTNIIISTPAITHVKCAGGNDGTISVTATGGSNLIYAWTAAGGFTSSSNTLTGLRSGIYTLNVSESGGCPKTITATVNDATALTTAPQSTNIKCKGDATGTINLNATGGTGTLSVNWTAAGGFTATGQILSSLKAGVYNAVIVDANNCTKNETITITEPADSLKILTTTVTKVACNGGQTGAIALTVSGGTPQYSYAWTGAAGFTSTLKDVSGLRIGTYYVSFTDMNLCRVTQTMVMTDNPVITSTASTTDATGSPNGTITLNVAGGAGGFTYNWGGQGVVATNQNQTGLCPGTYNVTITDASTCRITQAVTLNGSCSSPMRIATVNPVAAGCLGNNLGRIDVTFEGGIAPFTIQWLKMPTNDIIKEELNAPSRSSFIDRLPSGTYRIKIIDNINQTFLSPPYEVRGTVTPLSITAAIAPESCTGGDGRITLTIANGAAPYSVRWADRPTSDNRFERADLRAGTYGISIADNNGCIKDTGNIIVPRNPCPLLATPTPKAVRCFGNNDGEININIANGEPPYQIRWAGGSTTVNNSPSRTAIYNITGLAAASYTITITDNVGQNLNLNALVSTPTQIIVEKRVTASRDGCNGSIVLAVGGGVGSYAYRWNTGVSSRDLFNLCCDDNRRYSVTVTDGNNCEVATGNDTIACNNTILTLDSSNVRNPNCRNDSTNSRVDLYLRGGVLPLNYAWQNERSQNVGGNSATLLNMAPGNYCVTVTDSKTPVPNKIIRCFTIRVLSNFAIQEVATVNAGDNFALNGSATVRATGGILPYSYKWCDGTTTTTATNAGLRAGSCDVVVTDGQNCSVTQTFIIRSNDCATVRKNSQFYSLRDTFNVKCRVNCDGSATIVALSPDYKLPIQSYRWASNEVGPTAFKLCAGQNTVTITDAEGKTCISRINMKAPDSLDAQLYIDNKLRTAEVIARGGVEPYNFRWTNQNVDTSRKIIDIKAGKIFVLVTDYLGCNIIKEGDVDPEGIACLDAMAVVTPNDDGHNENFRIFSCDLKGIHIDIYNRWGQIVYTRDNYIDQWQGNNQDNFTGKQLPDGVYMYILTATDKGKQLVNKGTVNLLRN